MTYASMDMLKTRFGEKTLIALTDRADPPAGQIDADLVAQELAKTDAVIDGYLAAKYRLPLVDVPPVVEDIALSIAIYKLHVYATDQKVKDDYDQALRSLREIAAGTIKLPVAGIEPAASGAEGVQFIDRCRPLSPESMTGFI